MKRCLVWGTGFQFTYNFRQLQYYEHIGQIKIIGITSNDSFYDSILGYPFIEKSSIDSTTFDILIVMTARELFHTIKKEAISLGIKEEIIVPLHTMTLPGFDFDKYLRIKKNIPTIFAPMCWGGITYSNLGLEFQSPFINMWVHQTDYLRFLKNPKHYINSPLTLEKMTFDANLNSPYPVARCDDIFLNFNHYPTFEEALTCWNRRKMRINWDNVIAIFYNEDENLIDEFCKLPYEKKFCFVPYSSDNPIHVGIDYKKRGWGNIPFGQIANDLARGNKLYYDIFDLLLYNKVTLLTKI